MAPPFLVVMGVSGSGKSTLAERLALFMGGQFLEGDDFHPPANKGKMGSGIALDDQDRMPWFDALIAAAKDCQAHGVTPVLSCSALKQRYRDYLFRDFLDWRLIYLEGSFDLIKARMDARQHEYMTSALLKSQFATLEIPYPHPRLLTLTSEMNPDEWVTAFANWFPETH